MKHLLLLVMSFMLTSCSLYYGIFEGPGELVTDDPSEKPTPEMLAKASFSAVMTDIFRPKCVSCHGNSGGVNLESYQSARQFLRQIEQSTLIEKRMPKSPYAPLTKQERLLLRAWIEAGGPDSSSSGGDEPPPPQVVLEPTFDSIKMNILEMKCTVCHKPGGKAENIPLLTKEDLLDSPLEIVIPGNPEESMLMIVFQEDARKFMPPKKSGIAPLTQNQIDVIEKWILDGAKD